MLIPLGFLAASSSAISYFIASIGAGGDDRYLSVSVDLDRNIYCSGRTNSQGAGSNDALITKYDSSGNLIWQRILGGASSDIANGIVVDNSGNVYITGVTASAGAGGNDALLAKYDSSGTIQWQRVLGGASADLAISVVLDGSGNVYISGNTSSQGAGGTDALLAKYDSSGTLQWQRILGGASGDIFQKLTIDSSGNLYVCGDTQSQGAGQQDALLAKYDSSGTLQWQRILGSAQPDTFFGITADNSGNVYVTGLTQSINPGIADLLITKYDSSGNLQWQGSLVNAPTSEIGTQVALDSSGNVYITGITFDKMLLAKYDSSGTLQYQRIIGGANFESGNSIFIDANDDILMAGISTSINVGNNDAFLVKVPSDGSLTGTYVLNGQNIDYSASSLTTATTTLTAATSTLTAATSTLTTATSTLTAYKTDL